jgi:hypothetical protein
MWPRRIGASPHSDVSFASLQTYSPFTLFLEADMKTKVLWALIALNVLLLAGLLSPLGHSTAQAQLQAPAAHAGDHFLMISGEVNGAPSALLYLVDENTNQLSARLYIDNPRGGLFNDMAPIDLSRVFEVH